MIKKLLFLLVIAFTLSFTGSDGTLRPLRSLEVTKGDSTEGGLREPQASNVFICNNGKTEVYHLTKECSAMKRCTSGIKPLKLEEAKEEGLRLCGYED